MTDSPTLLRTAEAAARVRLKTATLEKYRVTGDGPPFYRVGPKQILYDPVELDCWARSSKFASTSQPLPTTAGQSARPVVAPSSDARRLNRQSS